MCTCVRVCVRACVHACVHPWPVDPHSSDDRLPCNDAAGLVLLSFPVANSEFPSEMVEDGGAARSSGSCSCIVCELDVVS